MIEEAFLEYLLMKVRSMKSVSPIPERAVCIPKKHRYPVKIIWLDFAFDGEGTDGQDRIREVDIAASVEGENPLSVPVSLPYRSTCGTNWRLRAVRLPQNSASSKISAPFSSPILTSHSRSALSHGISTTTAPISLECFPLVACLCQ